MLDTDFDPGLGALGQAAEAYVRDIFGVSLHLRALRPTTLPHFLVDRYHYWQGMLLDQPVILMASKKAQQGATAEFLKHRDLVRRELGVRLVLLLLDQVTAPVRRQLLERQVGFVAPAAQIFVPEAFLDLRERGTGGTIRPTELISPTAQLLILANLLGQPIDDANLTELAHRYSFAVMSMSRALDELEGLGVAKARVVGRQRRLQFLLKNRDLWDAVEDRLRSPVRRVATVKDQLPEDFAPLAGESALAHYTILAPPRIERRAIPAKLWRRLEQDEVLEPATSFDRQIELETWTYNPRLLTTTSIVDPLSLYLSVRYARDERVLQAADELLEAIEW